MSKRGKLFLLVLSVVIVTALVVVRTNKTPVYKKGSSGTFDTALSGALSLYREIAAAGIDMSSGPCLTNDLMPGWVVDIVHRPREPVDDLPGNQCQAYLEGRAIHFVELDTSGNLMRIR